MKQLNRKISLRALKVVLVIAILVISGVFTLAAGENFAVPNTFSSGTTISSSQMNANFQAVGQALPASKTMLFGPTTIPAGEQNISGLLTVTPPANGYLIIFANGTVTVGTNVWFAVRINKADASGNKLSYGENMDVQGTNSSYNVSFLQGYVTAGIPLYFYLETELTTSSPGDTIQGNLSALFIPAPNQLP